MKDIRLLKKYLKDISRHRLLTKDEEIALSKRIKKDDNEALQTLINANLKLVVKISMEFYKGTASIMDIIQNGNLGLMKAAKKFDHARGVKFSTYAAFWIKQSILRGFIKPAYNINISYRKDAINKRIKEFVRQFSYDNDRFPKVEEITQALRVSRRDAIDILQYFCNTEFSLNDSFFEEGEEIIDNIPDETYNPEKVMEFRSLLEEIDTAVDSFNLRESEIIRRRFGFDYKDRETLQSLGQKYAITAEAARQIEKRVLHSLKHKYPYLSYYYYTG